MIEIGQVYQHKHDEDLTIKLVEKHGNSNTMEVQFSNVNTRLPYLISAIKRFINDGIWILMDSNSNNVRLDQDIKECHHDWKEVVLLSFSVTECFKCKEVKND